MAFLVEQAGGLATTGNDRILDIMPQQIHERYSARHTCSMHIVAVSGVTHVLWWSPTQTSNQLCLPHYATQVNIWTGVA